MEPDEIDVTVTEQILNTIPELAQEGVDIGDIIHIFPEHEQQPEPEPVIVKPIDEKYAEMVSFIDEARSNGQDKVELEELNSSVRDRLQEAGYRIVFPDPSSSKVVIYF